MLHGRQQRVNPQTLYLVPGLLALLMSGYCVIQVHQLVQGQSRDNSVEVRFRTLPRHLAAGSAVELPGSAASGGETLVNELTSLITLCIPTASLSNSGISINTKHKHPSGW